MYRGHHKKPVQKTRSGKKYAILCISLILILTLAVGGILAFLSDVSASVENRFTPAEATITINEDKTQNTKYNISVTNAASQDAIAVYVRAKLMVYWTDVIDGEEQVIPKPEGASIVIPDPVNDWFCVGDTYYYPDVLKAGESSDVMISQDDPIKVSIPEGSSVKCYIDVQAEAIQAEPASVVGQVWTDVKTENGKLTSKLEAGE